MASKIDFAREHIETAIALFQSGSSMACILTLAGAAEEVLGNLLARNGKENMMAHVINRANKSQSEMTPQQIYRLVNRTRNAMKHAKDPAEDSIELGPDEAALMLARAIANYQFVTGNLTPSMAAFFDTHLRKSVLLKYST